jgi:hypothetical protein
VELLDRGLLGRRPLAFARGRRRSDLLLEAEPVEDRIGIALGRDALDREAGQVIGQLLLDVEGEQRRAVTPVNGETKRSGLDGRLPASESNSP